ncbi:helix-turn-helix domain-containing protein [Pseudoclavibacter alba]|uniref:Helix-turn-helix domain-containing protein n=1 Tax=Pseudoclavibacter albus TaxID=272241 RepID=A0ABT2HUE6_9MICO|nr:helix-turn-helix domain-containing protein [Pseudoclavibacter alba]MCT2041942.1 helix-turn-helix domain-containing protein [Pseudoclavibacter alba]
MSSLGHGAGMPQFLTIADVAEIMKCSVDEVMAVVHSGELHAIRIGANGAWRVDTEVLMAFIDDQYEAQRRHAAFQEAEFSDVPEIGVGRWAGKSIF